MKNIIFFAFVVLALTACSNKQLYQVGQDYQKSECIKGAGTAAQYNDCVNADKKSFEEYEKERKVLAKKKAKK
jgi:hypothetical protein